MPDGVLRRPGVGSLLWLNDKYDRLSCEGKLPCFRLERGPVGGQSRSTCSSSVSREFVDGFSGRSVSCDGEGESFDVDSRKPAPRSSFALQDRACLRAIL
jgi:hypothetical protein